MALVVFDTETHLIKPGLTAPRLVCVSAVDAETGEVSLLDRNDGLMFMASHLVDSVVVGHNVFYDLGVLCAEDPAIFVPLVFRAFDEFRVRDTSVRQKLIDIAQGNLKFLFDAETGKHVKSEYGLAALLLRLCGETLPKEGTWRLRYAALDGVPVNAWPKAARDYAENDAIATLRVYKAQEKLVEGEEIPTEDRNTREQWALHLMSMWGVRTDGAAVAQLRSALEEEQAEAMLKLSGTGVVKPKIGGWAKDMKAIKARVVAGFEKQGKKCSYTSKGAVTVDHDALVESGDPDLRILADAAKGAKLLSTYVPMLEHGTRHPICARYNGLVESNRTSCSEPNCQNPPRGGGVRQCFVPRPGYVFASCDYDTIELRSLAQACIDLVPQAGSAMAAALRAGEDLHLNLAADFMGISREEAKRRMDEGDRSVADMRQLMKPANFGFPGGMASDSFVDYAKGYGYTIDRDLAARIHLQWHRAWPEMQHYFGYVKRAIGNGENMVKSPRSRFVRGGMGFCQCANHFFQSLTATGAKDALWHVARECYTDPKSSLWGSRPVIFLHDEIIAEVPEAGAHAAAERLAKVMVDVMQKWIPDIPIKASPVLMRKWLKGAKPVRVEGRLVPSKAVEIEGKTKWVKDAGPDELGLARAAS